MIVHLAALRELSTPVLSRLARLIVFFAAVQILGGHWLALQSVAWVGMLATYSRGENLVAAIEKTFDGEHPCGLCKVVKKGLKEEHKQQESEVIVKLEAVLGMTMHVPAPCQMEWKYRTGVSCMARRSLAPPTPPPQAA
ncbi:MAG: hypothetical protein JWL59_1979 [Chthoniobacteraceae bacterium]|nr:hypothetical protein [Chthoniobacteraceae bacterium]